ncbi:MAG: amidase [Gaiellaceae bacterium]
MAKPGGHTESGTAARFGYPSISGIRSSLDTGNESVSALVAAALSRVAERNAELNAIVTVSDERALEVGRSIDERRARGDTRMLDGLTFTAKDVISVAGIRMTAGSRLYADHVPRETAPAIRRLEDAGAVLIGKANCPEFGLDPHTENELFGATKNPLDSSRTPGGSSGGDAAAVAAGLVPFGIGSDYGGSIRWPAQCTGTVGFRPTSGLVSGTGHFPFVVDGRPTAPNSASFLGGVQTMAPVTRSVEDAWTVLSVLAGPDGLDSRVAPVSLGNPAEVDPSRLAIAWAAGDGSVEPDPGVTEALRGAAAALAGVGMDVSELRPPQLEACERIYAAYRAADGLALHRQIVAGREELLTPTMRTWFERVDEASVSELQAIAGERDAVRATVLAFMEQWPILMLPVANGPAFKLGAADFDERFRLLTPCRAISLLGLPSCSVPVAGAAEGMPLSVQIVGRPFHDHEVAAVAAELDGALRA